MFAEKERKNAFSCLSASKEEGSCRFFSDFNYTPKEILQYDSLISMTDDFDFWKNFTKLNTMSLGI